jgi:hypothetical protein
LYTATTPHYAGRSQPSLNLSHAVAVVVSQLFDIKQQRLLAANQQQQQQQQQVAAAGLPGLDPSVGPLAPSGSLFEDGASPCWAAVAGGFCGGCCGSGYCCGLTC